MSAASMVVSLLLALLGMAIGGTPAAAALEQIKRQAGDYWPHLEKMLTGDGFKAACLQVPEMAGHSKWFKALAAEISGTGKKKNGRTATSTADAGKPAATKRRAAAGASTTGKSAGRTRRGS